MEGKNWIITIEHMESVVYDSSLKGVRIWCPLRMQMFPRGWQKSGPSEYKRLLESFCFFLMGESKNINPNLPRGERRLENTIPGDLSRSLHPCAAFSYGLTSSN